MIVQPQSPPRSNLRTWCSNEWQHLENMSLSTFALLALPTLVTFWFNPLLPVLAYALQLWAGQSWQWPARWGSIRMWARQGGWFIGTLVALGILADVHIWFFPALVALVQIAWRDHLPGELGLLPFPLQYNNLFARLTLLLPLAPILALLYEWIDPRTQVDPPRTLLPRDLVKPEASPPPVQPKASPEPEKDQNTSAQASQTSTPPPSPAAASKRPKTTQAKQSGTKPEPQDLEQLTIDSFLAPDQGQGKTKPVQRTSSSTEAGAQSSGTARKKKKQSRDQAQATPAQAAPTTEPGTSVSPAKQPETINWDDVAE